MKNRHRIKIILLFFFIQAISYGQQVKVFTYTGEKEMFLVPAGVDTIFLDVKGAEGKKNSENKGIPGKGGRIQGLIPVHQNDIIEVFVGGQCRESGINSIYDGGNGGASNTSNNGGCGGGASLVRLIGQSNNIVAIAGGGGGCGGNTLEGFGTNGGVGGGLFAGDGENGAGLGGSGGSQNEDGLGGLGAGACGLDGSNSSNGAAGDGGAVTCGNGFYGGGGGGGGYKGGGGGGGSAYILCCPDWSGGGGGGSSYTSSLVGDVVHTSGYQIGLGEVIFTYFQNTKNEDVLAESAIVVTPNPAIECITIENSESSKINIILLNIRGEKMIDINSNQDFIQLNVNQMPNGVYFLHLILEEKNIMRQIIKI